jgi:sulfopyruvate decarboxylase alpha subunit
MTGARQTLPKNGKVAFRNKHEPLHLCPVQERRNGYSMSEQETWPADVFDALMAHSVRVVSYVPDAGHIQLIDQCVADPLVSAVPLTTEEEGIALLGGVWLGGVKGVLLMQSSGVGNCINMLSLPNVCSMPLLMIVTMRGQWGEFNPWQVPMGQNTPGILAQSGVLTFPVDDQRSVGETVNAAATMAFEGNAATAVLISQRLLGAKTFGK